MNNSKNTLSEILSLIVLDVPLTPGMVHYPRLLLRSLGNPVCGAGSHAEVLKSSKGKGTFIALTGMLVVWNGNSVTASVPIPEKFKTLLEREERFFKPLVVRESGPTSMNTFFGLNFVPSKDVMTPRASSETLVRAALSLLKPAESSTTRRILDLGTGSGCLLISLLRNLPQTGQGMHSGVGMDISVEALQVAQKNAVLHGLERSVVFLEGAFVDPKLPLNSPSNAPFDLIISNPPYLNRRKAKSFAHRLEMEPEIALYTDCPAYTEIRLGLDKIPTRIGTLLILEIGARMSYRVRGIIEHSTLKEGKNQAQAQGSQCWRWFSTHLDRQGMERALIFVRQS